VPFIIWGSRGIVSNLDEGKFYCPECEEVECDYRLRSSRTWFTLYFIPIFPVSGRTQFVECDQCGGTFTEEVLEFVPPSKSERLLGRLYDALEDGQSVEALLEQLERRGMSPAEARETADELTRGKTWNCPMCDRTYIEGVKRCPDCARSN
jgi:predicted RNA-binding Zn-ribbon protein involved in translation (DUF1610 family)